MVSHVTPQLPQLLASLVTSTQVALRAIWGDAQTGWHTAAVHCGLAVGHTLPHLPQFVGSNRIGAHLLLQESVPAGQAHLPAVHTWPLLQTVPHAPQLLESVCRLEQAPLQTVWLLEQLMQEPPEQVAPAEQLCPQKPQLLLSVFRFVHVLLQFVWPLEQLTEVLQLPSAQVWPLAHAWPQEPQFLLSVFRLVQVLLQRVPEQVLHWPPEQ